MLEILSRKPDDDETPEDVAVVVALQARAAARSLGLLGGQEEVQPKPKTCATCGRAISQEGRSDGAWHDADDDAGLVFCTDQDETHDGVRHEPAPLPSPEAKP